jgi:cellulose synthase/poly-beta-1,6-N-acetylglucosamine synthase-like glycosyltransferase
LMKQPKLAIVIIGRNEGDRLASCLQSVAAISAEAELIYVDSASTDGSAQLAANFGAEAIVLHGGTQTAARARNAGWQRARAPLILFLDGDTILNQHFPAAAIKVLESEPAIAAVWGHRRELHPEHSIYNRILDLDWIYAAGETDYCGGDVLMRRSALAEVEGYDPGLIAGEEPELCRRLRARGYRIVHIDSPMTGHDLNMTRFSQYWRRAVRAGHAYAEMAVRYRGTADPMWSQESRRNLRIGAFWITWLLIALLFAVLRSLWVVPWLALLPVLSARSAWKARSKARGQTMLLLLYGLHSQLQHIPILIGQLRCLQSRRSRERPKQIDYKQGASA